MISVLLSQPKQSINIKDIFSSDDVSAITKNTTSTETIKKTPTLETKDQSGTENNNHMELQVNASELATDNSDINNDLDNKNHNIFISTEYVMGSTASVTPDKDLNDLTAHSIEEKTEAPLKEKNALNKTNQEKSTCDMSVCPDDVFSQAITYRQQGEHKRAFTLFTKAAQKNHLKAMGALGRAYFLAEGTDRNPPLGLAWLIQAANKNLPQAISRVEKYKSDDERLYQQAKILSENLFAVD